MVAVTCDFWRSGIPACSCIGEAISLAPGERREILVDMSNGDECRSPVAKRRALLIVFVASLSIQYSGFYPGANAAPNRPSAVVTDSLPMRLLPTEIMAGSPFAVAISVWVMTRVLMDSCGTQPY